MLPRPCNHLVEIRKKYPDVWKMYDLFLQNRGKAVSDWPPWCYCPLAAAYTIVKKVKGVSIDTVNDIPAIGALAAWRLSQGIYRFDPDVAQAVMETDLEKSLPSDILLRMPEWCVYIETPYQHKIYQDKITGFFAFLEWNDLNNRQELQLLLDIVYPEEHLVGVPLRIDNKLPLSDAIESAYNMGLKNTGNKASELIGTSLIKDRAKEEASYIAPLVGLVLYLCSKNAEVRNNRSGTGLDGLQHPAPKKTKQGLRFFQADRPEIWEVGFALGEQIRTGRGESAGTHAGPRPHIRRAHWHTFWEGPLSNPLLRSTNVKWLPPIPVAFDDGEVMPTIKAVD